LLIRKVFLTVADRRSDNIYTTVSAVARRHVTGIPNYLVNSLKGQIEKHDKFLRSQSEQKAK